MAKYMEATDGNDAYLGTPMMEAQDVAGWIQASVLPKAREDRQPLLDIYAEILKLHVKIDRIEAYLEASARQAPWYRVWWATIKSYFTLEN